MPRRSLPDGLTPRGLNRDAAAAYVGVSASLFDRLVRAGKAPKAIELDGRRVWDRLALDRVVFDGAAPGRTNEWDTAA